MLGRDALPGLSRLSSLNLAHNLLVELHSNVSSLHGLVSLDVSVNSLAVLPSQLACCSALQRLNISHNKLRTLGEAVCQLTKLVVLDVQHNILVRLPSDLISMRQLQMLNASNNKLDAIPPLPTSVLCVWLDHNRISEIPPQIGDAAGLETLHATFNKIENLPPTLARTALRQSRGLKVEGNPLSCIPDQLRNSPHDIIGFLEDVHEGLEQVIYFLQTCGVAWCFCVCLHSCVLAHT